MHSGLLFSLPLNRVCQFLFQALMRSDKMIIAAKPFQGLHSFWDELCRSPGSPGQFGDALPEVHVNSFNECCINPSAQPGFLEALLILLLLAPQNSAFYLHCPPPGWCLITCPYTNSPAAPTPASPRLPIPISQSAWLRHKNNALDHPC